MDLATNHLKPDLLMLLMHGSIGQAVFDEANILKQSASVGVVIMTRTVVLQMSWHTKLAW